MGAGKRRRKSGRYRGAAHEHICIHFFFLFLYSLCLIVKLNLDKEERKEFIPCLIYIYLRANGVENGCSPREETSLFSDVSGERTHFRGRLPASIYI